MLHGLARRHGAMRSVAHGGQQQQIERALFSRCHRKCVPIARPARLTSWHHSRSIVRKVSDSMNPSTRREHRARWGAARCEDTADQQHRGQCGKIARAAIGNWCSRTREQAGKNDLPAPALKLHSLADRIAKPASAEG